MRAKSQSSLEFLILAGVMFFFFVGIVTVVGGKIVDLQKSKDRQEVHDIMDVVTEEVKLAQTSYDGYHRKFRLPKTISGRDYELRLITDESTNENLLIILYNDQRYESSFKGKIRSTPTSPATVYKGENFITKQDDEIHVESGDPCRDLSSGAHSYCIGGTCYCFRGYYDKECEEENDFIVDYCGGQAKPDGGVYDSIDCVKEDPCNEPPEFTSEPSVKDRYENGATISFTSNEKVVSTIEYKEVSEVMLCEENLFAEDPEPGSQSFTTFEKDHEDTLSGLDPERTYCFRVEIKDEKGGTTLSDPSPDTTFTTTDDMTAPVIEGIVINPKDGYMGTAFSVEAVLYEPSGIRIANATINRSDWDRSSIAEYELKEKDGSYAVSFNIEENFTDENSSYGLEPEEAANTLFYSTFNTPELEAEYSKGDSQPVLIHSGTSVDDGRFHNATYIGVGDGIDYAFKDNLKLEKGTIEFWVNTTWGSDDMGTHYFFDEGTFDNRMSILKTGSRMYFFIKSSENEKSYNTNLTIDGTNWKWEEGKWYFIAAVWNLTSETPEERTMTLYINKRSKTGKKAVKPEDSSEKFAIGYNMIPQAKEDPWEAEAQIDHLVISKEPKNKSQIFSDMALRKNYTVDLHLMDEKGNEHYYPMVLNFTVNYTEEP